MKDPGVGVGLVDERHRTDVFDPRSGRGLVVLARRPETEAKAS